MRGRECGIAIGPKLVTHAAIMQRVSETVGMVEHFGKRNRLREVLAGLLPLARQLQRVAALRVRANAGVVTAELMTKVTVARHVVELDAVAATVHAALDVALEKRRRPPAMMRLEQQFAIAGALRKRDEFAGPLPRQRGLVPEIGIDP